MTTVTFTSSGSWSIPAGVIQTDCQCWGASGNSTGGLHNSHGGDGGGGGAYAEEPTLAVSGTSISFTIGTAGSGTATSFPGTSVTVTANAGSGRTAGAAGSNTVAFAGGSGGAGSTGTGNRGGGGGGGSGGASGTGGNGGNGTTTVGGGGGSAGAGGGAAGGSGGGPGSSGAAGNVPGAGGGGGGSTSTLNGSAGAGTDGQITLTYTVSVAGTATLSGVGTLTATATVFNSAAPPPVTPAAPGQAWLHRFGFGRQHQVLPGRQLQTISGAATLAGVGSLTAFGALPNPVVVNQWASNYGQGSTFGTTTSALQSNVVALNPANTAGPGSGTPSPGNWLFCISSWTQIPAIAKVRVGVSDDTHPWWREVPASNSSGNVRTSISYVPNIGTGSANTIVPTNVYVAPDAEIAAINTLVVEIAGLGPWDTVTATTSGYTTGTSLNLSAGAPSGQAFTIAGFGGDNVSSGQAFLPGGWQALATQTQTNGVDTTCDNILTAAFLPSTTGSLSVSATSSSPEDISGFMTQVLVTGVTPSFPANPNWPKFVVEAGLGSGFNTPDSEVTWTDITSRIWSIDETTGVQFQLGQIQSTHLIMELDNIDGALVPSPSPWSFTAAGTPLLNNYFIVSTGQSASISIGNAFTDTSNPGTLFVVTSLSAPSGGFVNVSFTPPAASAMNNPDVVSQANFIAGTPIRIRAALGTLGGVVTNRWYMIQRNVMQWEERINENYRRYISATLTDVWAVLSSVPPTFYRSEIYEDNPYAWWPMDDQAASAGVLPTVLLNAAVSNTNTLNIIPSPGGIVSQDAYGTNGTDVTNKAIGQNVSVPLPSVAVYAVGVSQGWMYGDPQSAAPSFATSNPEQPSPGSAAWQQSGAQGAGGSNGWFLACHDPAFPPLSSGITVKGWFNAGFFASAQGFQYSSGFSTATPVAGQPYNPITLCTLSTDTAPVAILQIDLTGNLNLITYNGTTGTSHAIYSATDIRGSSWHSVDITLTTTTWTVLVDGGLSASVSGSATGMTSAWTWLTLNGDYGTSGGTSPGSIQNGGNVSYSHWAVFPSILPAWRLLAHYTAAITGFGLLPAPVGQVSAVNSPLPTTGFGNYSLTPDGSLNTGLYGGTGTGPPFGSLSTFTFSATVTANAGSFSSGPAARVTIAGIGQLSNGIDYGDAVWVTWTGTAPQFTVYTSASADTETSAAVAAGAGDSFSSGYGASASGHGVAQLSGGTGASPPAAATTLGDGVGQRIERLMRAGRTITPNRSIDPAPLLVQAPGTSGGGQQVGQSIQQITQSDGGLLFVDNVGHLTYWQRPHLAAQYSLPVWVIGPTAPPTPGAPAGTVPYYPDIHWITDPQRIWNNITIQPFAPDGAQLPLVTPTSATLVNSSQIRYGAQPLTIVSWLQNQAEMQLQANWLFQFFGQPQRRAENVRIDAAAFPAAWRLVMGVNVGDISTVENWQVGGGGSMSTVRVTQIRREIRFGGQQQGDVMATVELTADFEPTSYWS